MSLKRETWRRNYRLARQLNSLRKRFIGRLPSRGISILVTHCHADATEALFRQACDPLGFSVMHRYRCKAQGVRYSMGGRPRLPA